MDQSEFQSHKTDQSNIESRSVRVPGSTSKEQNLLDNSFLRISEHAGLVSCTFSFILKKVTMDSRVPENGTRKPCLKFHFCTLLNTLTWLDIQ